MKEIIIILHNIRSTHNVGSILRTAEGFGVNKVIFSGYTPHPLKAVRVSQDHGYLPHLADKINQQIHKTALGAEDSLVSEYHSDPPIENLRSRGYRIVGLEQDKNSIMINSFERPNKVALLLGEEVNGINQELLELCDDIVEIPMQGKKESFNVSVAAGIALYALSE